MLDQTLAVLEMSLLGGSTAKMVKTACKVLLFTAHFSQEGRVIPWKILGSADLYPLVLLPPKIGSAFVRRTQGKLPCGPGTSLHKRCSCKAWDFTFMVKIENV